MISATVYDPLSVTTSDRLGLTLFFAVVLHAILILGVSIGQFDLKPKHPAFQPIEITLVTTRTEKAPQQADYLAQANNEGGGNTDDPTPATNPPPLLLPLPISPPEPQVDAAALPPAEPSAQPKSKKKEVMAAQRKSEAKIAQQQTAAEEPSPALPSAAQLIGRSMEIASLSAQVNQSEQAYSQRPRQKFISARTQEYKYASYMEAWRNKIERIGNLNYPDEAKRRDLSGSLILDVALNADGSINNITLRRSSGQKILDDAALRIVKLAAPYAPFPDAILQETDILHITRTWQFLRDNRLSSQ